MELEKRKDAKLWFDFLNNLQKEPVSAWSEDLFKVFNLINRYQTEKIIPKLICGIPTVVFIHSTKMGPALGGTRARLVYSNMANFFRDGLKLSSAMTYKAIWARVPLGGGKVVIFASEEEINNEEFAHGFGDFLNEINIPHERFFTGEDVGCSEEFVDRVAQYSQYITGKSEKAGGLGDPSPHTAEGIFLATKAIIEQSGIFYGALQGKSAAVQGAGKVALPLIEMLINEGVTVYFSENDGDPEAEKRARIAKELGATRVPCEEIYSVPCHIFMPCAIGGVINKKTRPRLSWMCRVIVGAANNILDTPEDGIELHKKRIHYAPDYVVNRWGLEWVTQEKNGVTDLLEAQNNLTDIAIDILDIFSVSRDKNLATSEIADTVSRKVLSGEVESIEQALEQF